MRLSVLCAGVVLVAGLTACSGDGLSDDATVEEFCANHERYHLGFLRWMDDGDKGEVEDAVDQIRATGVPDSMSTDLRRVYADLLTSVEEADSPDAHGDTVGEIRDRADELVDELEQYTRDTCRPSDPSVPSD